ncbi:MAG: hypothetical protein AAGB48_08270 [Planctomycetota bacterium]
MNTAALPYLASVLIVAMLAAATGWAQPSAGSSDGVPHAWFVLPAGGGLGSGSGPGDRATSDAGLVGERVLLHAPPRVPSANARPSPPTRLASAMRLPLSPTHLAASGPVLFAVGPAEEDGSRRVEQVRAEPRGVSDLWAKVPSGRLRLLPALEDARGLRGVAAFEESLWALVDRDDRLVLNRLTLQGWETVSEIPASVSSARVQLWADDLGVVVLERESGGLALHRLAADGSWSSRALSVDPSWKVEPFEVLGVWRGEAIIARRPQDRAGVEVASVGSWGTATLVELERVPRTAASAIMGPTGRLLYVWNEGGQTDETGSALATPGVGAMTRRVLEVSLTTGRLISEAPATTTSPISRNEFRTLSLLLFVFMIVVVLVAVRPSPKSDAVVLPPGTAIGSAGRRLLATLLDAFPAVLVSGALTGVSPILVLGPLALPITGSLDIGPLLLALGLAATHCAIGEAISGRSIGKSMVGLFVARVDAGAGPPLGPGRFRPPTPGGAIVRNLVKWFLPPAAMLAISDPDGRHRGDTFARCAVLMPVPVNTE